MSPETPRPTPRPTPSRIFSTWLSPPLRSLCFGAVDAGGNGAVTVDDALEVGDDDEAGREEEREMADVNGWAFCIGETAVDDVAEGDEVSPGPE